MSNQEVVLTGDDLVVEYVERLVEALYLREERGVEINGLIWERLNQFIHYRVWSNNPIPDAFNE